VARKDRSFAAKVAHARERSEGKKCPVCGTVVKPCRVVVSQRKPATGSWGFAERIISLCKCTRAQYGIE
jgi:hypothetical protein